MSSGGEKGAKERSTAIDRQIEEDSRKFKKECKILLLGEWRVARLTRVAQWQWSERCAAFRRGCVRVVWAG
jgi:guanine nucleotide-binding protein subunit alpha